MRLQHREQSRDKRGQAGMSVLLAILEGDSYEWEHIRIVLLVALEFYQVIVSAARSGGKLATNLRSRIIDGALARVLIEKGASLAKQPVGLAPENSSLTEYFGKPRSRSFG